jgi:hypothetical protein
MCAKPLVLQSLLLLNLMEIVTEMILHSQLVLLRKNQARVAALREKRLACCLRVRLLLKHEVHWRSVALQGEGRHLTRRAPLLATGDYQVFSMIQRRARE